MTQQQTFSVLMVCLGNICRSPSAHAIMQHKVDAAGLGQHIVVDSAGTGDYHIGKAPDPRSIDAAAQRGYDLRPLRARQVTRDDFQRFDYLVAMDHSNRSNLLRLCDSALQARISLLLEYAGEEAGTLEVPDPYYGAEDGFEQVLDLVERGCEGLLRHLQSELQRRG